MFVYIYMNVENSFVCGLPMLWRWLPERRGPNRSRMKEPGRVRELVLPISSPTRLSTSSNRADQGETTVIRR
jgi:hypothetical protein